jgi:hypothetical protein
VVAVVVVVDVVGASVVVDVVGPLEPHVAQPGASSPATRTRVGPPSPGTRTRAAPSKQSGSRIMGQRTRSPLGSPRRLHTP